MSLNMARSEKVAVVRQTKSQTRPEVLSDAVVVAAAKSVSYNIILQVLMRIISFLSNAFIIRLISKDVLGVINVRLMLLYSTIHCLSREAFRRSCLCKIDQKSHQKIINLLWFPFPICFFTGIILCYIWRNVLLPPDVSTVPCYGTSVYFVFASVLIEIMAEPLYVFGQSFHFIKLKVIIEGLYLSCRNLCMLFLLTSFPQLGLYNFCYSQFISSCIYTMSYYGFFFWYFNAKSTKLPGSVLPITSMKDFLPKFNFSKECIDVKAFALTWSFYKQTILKQFLTEGEKYIMTVLNVLSFSEQGIYDIVNNLGSLTARLIFLPIEESGYLLFSHLVKRGCPSPEQEYINLYFHVLKNLLKLMCLLGGTVLVFGHSYSKLLLLLYGGEDLSNSMALKLLRCHCVYILFLSINGVTECFVNASMDSSEIDKYNRKMVVFSAIFLILAYFLTTTYGSIGFLLANCSNVSLRIIHSFCFIRDHFNTDVNKVVKSFLPHHSVLVCLSAILAITSVSEVRFCCSEGYKFWLLHCEIGFFCFCVLLAVIFVSEKDLIQFMMRQFFKKCQ